MFWLHLSTFHICWDMVNIEHTLESSENLYTSWKFSVAVLLLCSVTIWYTLWTRAIKHKSSQFVNVIKLIEWIDTKVQRKIVVNLSNIRFRSLKIVSFLFIGIIFRYLVLWKHLLWSNRRKNYSTRKIHLDIIFW